MPSIELGENGGTLSGGNTVPSKYPQGYFKDKDCGYCGTRFTPTNPCHRYCTSDCAKQMKFSAYLKRSYGITVQEYSAMAEMQDHKCAVCKEDGYVMDKYRHQHSLNVDHCHKTGRVRGLLCHDCNRALGLFKDEPERLEAALRYFEGVTTIPQGSRVKRPEAPSPSY